MITLHKTTTKLEIVLAGAITTNQLEVASWYNDLSPVVTADTFYPKFFPKYVSTNNTTDVSIVDAPGTQGVIRQVASIFVYNKDTTAATVTIKKDDAGTETILVKVTVATGESLYYESGRGWYVLTTSGAIKQSSGISGPGSSSDHA